MVVVFAVKQGVLLIHTFPLAVRKELEVRVVARDWLAWRKVIPVGLAGVGILIAAARAQVLEGEKEEGRRD